MIKSLFNDGWKFHEFDLDADFEFMRDFKDYSAVNLPHDWMIYHTKDLYKNSIGFYRKNFTVPLQKDHNYSLRFEGVYMDCQIYCNDQKAFDWKYGYSTFDVDLTPYLKEGENTVYVLCTYKAPNTRWYSGAGIYRDVWFIDRDFLSFLPDGIYTSTRENDKGFTLMMDEEIQTLYDGEVLVKNTLFDPEGNAAGSLSSKLNLQKGNNKASFEMNVPEVKRWDIDAPNLYLLKSELIYDGRILDAIDTRIGFRTICFDCNKGFFLNGRRVKINGVCMHHDLGALGSAFNRSAMKRQMEKLLKMGVNSIRTSHNMPAVEMMDLADEMGILINSEAFDMWELPKTTYDYANFFPQWWERDTESWIRRDRNHPSVIIWSIGNEIYDTHAGNGLKWTILLRDKVRELDYYHNAYIGNGSNYIEWDNAQKCSNELELSGYNYAERLYDQHHIKYPNWCIFGSETASTLQSRGIYHFPLETKLLTHQDGQCSSLGNCTANWGARDVSAVVADHRDRDFVFGQYLWTGFDYIGEPTPYHTKNSFFGHIDTAGFEKDTYYNFQAEWTDYKKAPMAHLLPYWDFNEGQLIDVIAYTNAPYAELFFNGQSLGKQFIDHEKGRNLKACWKVAYEEGELVVRAMDEDGRVVAEDVQRSFGDPAKIRLEVENDTIMADGKSLAFVDISLEDEKGTRVANARNRVGIEISGPGRLVGLDNGDSTDYEEYKGSSRRLFSGRLLAIVAPTDEAGEITVRAFSKGLPDSTAVIKSLSSDSIAGEIVDEVPLEQERSDDIPVRKIELSCPESRHLNKDHSISRVYYKIYPENATYTDVHFCALTKDSVEANFVKIERGQGYADIIALGDGSFSVMAYSQNDKDHPEVISTLDFDIEGLGMAVFDAYSMVPGIQYTAAFSDQCKVSFLGGVFLPYEDGKLMSVTYENVDFGKIGSDMIHLPVFSFRDEVPVKIYADDEMAFEGVFRAKSIYNVYQENIFKLNKNLRGIHKLTFEFDVDDRISLQGFYFSQPQRAYKVINASEFDEISGDSYLVESDRITGIGNNVTITYEDMNFTEGTSKVRIVGRSNNKKTSMHLLFIQEEEVIREMADILFSEEYEEHFFDLPDIHTRGKVNLIFLPGSNFDLKEIEFISATGGLQQKG